MAYGVNKLSLEATIEMAERIETRAFEHACKKCHDETEIEARQKYRDYQFSIVRYLKELKELKK